MLWAKTWTNPAHWYKLNNKVGPVYVSVGWTHHHKKTRPLSDSEASTIYKLKYQSSNMQTGQGFKYRELVCPAGPSSLAVQLVCIQSCDVAMLPIVAKISQKLLYLWKHNLGTDEGIGGLLELLSQLKNKCTGTTRSPRRALAPKNGKYIDIKLHY